MILYSDKYITKSIAKALLLAPTLIVLLMQSAALAQTSSKAILLSESATLENYLVYAEVNSPALSVAFHNWQANVAKAQQAGVLPDPRINYAEQLESVETRVGAQQRKFSLSQSIPWFGKLGLRKSAAQERANAAEQKYIAAKLHLQAQVINLYFELYYLNQSISIVQDNLTLITEWENVAQKKYRSAILSQAKLAQIQIEQAKLTDKLQTQKANFSKLSVAFNATLDRESNANISLITEPSAREIELTDASIINIALEKSPTLHQQDRMVLSTNAALRLASRGALPNFTLGIEYIQTDEALSSGVFESGKDPIIAKIGLSLPLWFGKYKAEKREAQSRNHSALESRKHAENNLRSALANQLFKFHDALRKIDLYRNAMIPKATQALAVTQKEFKTGKTDFRNLIELQRELFTYLLSLQRSLTNHRQSLANIEALVGAKITGDPK